MVMVLLVLVIASATIVIVPRIASNMAESYRRAIIESSWRTMTDKLRLTLRNPGWISCKTAKNCVLRKDSASGSPILELHVREMLADMAGRFECGPVGKAHYCSYGISYDINDPRSKSSKEATKISLQPPGKDNKLPYTELWVYFNTEVPSELVGKVRSLPVRLGEVKMKMDLPRGVAVEDDKRYLCQGFLMGFNENGSPICKNISTKRMGVGEYVTTFVPQDMDKDDGMDPTDVPEVVRDCTNGDDYLLNYVWRWGKKYDHTCATRVKPWQVN